MCVGTQRGSSSGTLHLLSAREYRVSVVRSREVQVRNDPILPCPDQLPGCVPCEQYDRPSLSIQLRFRTSGDLLADSEWHGNRMWRI